MKIRTTFILSLTAILTLAAGSVFGAYSGGSGTAGDPYLISTVADYNIGISISSRPLISILPVRVMSIALDTITIPHLQVLMMVMDIQ